MAESDSCSRHVLDEYHMSPAVQAAFERPVLKLGTIVRLTQHELAMLHALPLMIRDLRPDQDIAREGDRPSQCCLIVEALAYRNKIVGEGKRQIFSYHISGDTPICRAFIWRGWTIMSAR